MDNHEVAFLATLKEDEDDEMTRLVYADWLEEQGRYEETLRQRSWTASKKWFVDLLNEWGGPGWYDGPDSANYKTFIEEVITQAERSLTTPIGVRDHFYFSCGANMSLQDHLNQNRKEFFKHLAIVSGLPIPEEFIENAYFSCAC